MEAVRSLEAAGVGPDESPTARRGMVEEERLATYPPPYPAGWYVVARTEDVKRKPLFVRCVGHDWVVFRDAAGKPRVLSAYCPHLGANLADGCVREGAIECPFHRWRIGGDGRVVRQPNAEHPDARYRTNSWAADELHGWIVAYHPHEAVSPGALQVPPYRLQRVPGIERGDLRHRGDYDAGRIRMHLLEFAENSADFGHFAPVHGQLRFPWTGITIPGMSIHHRAEWRRDEEEAHVSWFENEAILEFRGRRIDGSGARAHVRFEGPGSIVRFDFTLDRGGGRVVLFQSHTPVAPLEQHVRFRWFSERSVPKPIASFIVGNWVSQWRQDIGIWERKIYRSNPQLTRSDGPIHQLRRWYAQFYPGR